MKRIFSWLLCLMLLFSATAFAEEPDTLLEGLVTELVEGGFIMEDEAMGTVMLNVDDSTTMDGILLEQEIAVGQYVLVTYNGRLTKSTPPQAHADKIGCYVLTGTVTEFLDNGVLLTGDKVMGDVIVHMGGLASHVYPNVPTTVYYDGIMALSLPGQVNARHVAVPELTGVVSDRDETGFTLTDDQNVAYRVETDEKVLVTLPEIQEEEALLVGEAEATDDAEAADDAEAGDNAKATDDAKATDEAKATDDAKAGDEALLEPEADDCEISDIPLVTFENGDQVTVYYNGMMTKSIPAQITAIEIMVLN